MQKERRFMITRIVKQTVTYYEGDFDSSEEFDEYFNNLKSDEELLVDLFFDNFDEDNEEVVEDIKLEDIEELD